MGLVLMSTAYLSFRSSEYITYIYFAAIYTKTILMVAAIYSSSEFASFKKLIWF